MKSLLTLILFLLPVHAGTADTIYRCKKNGHVEFSDHPSDPSCELENIKVMEPAPQEVQRLEKEREKEEAQQRAQEEQAERLRLLRAQEAALLASKRLADAQRNLAEQEAARQQIGPSGFSGGGWWNRGLYIQTFPGNSFRVPNRGHEENYFPSRPHSSPAYPYAPSQIGPKGYPGRR